MSAAAPGARSDPWQGRWPKSVQCRTGAAHADPLFKLAHMPDAYRCTKASNFVQLDAGSQAGLLSRGLAAQAALAGPKATSAVAEETLPRAALPAPSNVPRRVLPSANGATYFALAKPSLSWWRLSSLDHSGELISASEDIGIACSKCNILDGRLSKRFQRQKY